jgi:hypothetical protein
VRLRITLATALAGLMALTPAVPALAAGVGGVEIVPPSGTSFRVQAPDRGTATVTFTAENVGTETATVRLYAASATESGGSWSVDGAGSASWLRLADRSVTLQPGEARELSFTVEGSDARRTGAIVVEQGAGTVVQRAATLVHAEPGPRLPLPLLLVALAVLLIALAGVGVARAARRPEPEPVPEPVPV